MTQGTVTCSPGAGHSLLLFDFGWLLLLWNDDDGAVLLTRRRTERGVNEVGVVFVVVAADEKWTFFLCGDVTSTPWRSNRSWWCRLLLLSLWRVGSASLLSRW